MTDNDVDRVAFRVIELLDQRGEVRSMTSGPRVQCVAAGNDVVEAIADAIIRKLPGLASAPTFGLMNARELASHLGVSVDYVYDHAEELGAMPLGDGPRARKKFDLDRARRALERRQRRPPEGRVASRRGRR